jgi:hypothetical protein
MPPKRVFRKAKSLQEEKELFEECVPKSTISGRLKTFRSGKCKEKKKDPRQEQCSFAFEPEKNPKPRYEYC